MTSPDQIVLVAKVDKYAAELRRDLVSRLGEEAVTWLALPPQWTGRLAECCGFPAPERKALSSWLDDAVAAGLGQRQALLAGQGDRFDLDHDGWPDVRFWMPEAGRNEILGDIKGRRTLRKLAATIGERIHEAPAEIERDPGVDRWADLAVRAPEDKRTGEWLMATVSACVADGRMAEALDWVYAAEALSPVLGEQITSPAARAKRLINLEYQRRIDARFVEHFMRREGQHKAVERLLDDRETGPWAVHFVGMGGVGKTMLIRYISGGVTADGGPDIVTTRVDFDHISPRYPAEEPGQLLRELASGLAGRLVQADQVSAYEHFTECADALDRAAASGRGGFGSADFGSALDAFRTLVQTIEQRVVLILDTCEELAKLYPAGEPVPSIERTFEILERLHEDVPNLRVVLAGRRLLAAEYANWQPPDHVQQPTWAVSLAEREYLELFEIRGFSEREARAFLSGGQEDRRMPADVEDAILRMAPDSGRVADLMTAEPQQADAIETEQLYNPYELALYADWFEETDRKLTAAEIESGDLGAYIQGRIIRRLPEDPPVAQALPVLAILGRVDIHILRSVLALPDLTVDRVFRILTEQEWIGTRAAEESGVTVLEVQPAVQRRLVAYFDGPGRMHTRDQVRETLCQELPRLLRRPVLDAAAVDHVAAAMRILPDESAVALWDELTERIRRDHEWTWAAYACARLLANDPDAHTPRPALEAAIRAVYIGALQRRDPGYNAAAEWTFVAAAASQHPDEDARTALADRSALGIAAADARHRARFARIDEPGPFGEAWKRAVADRGDGERLAAALATAEAFLDAGADLESGTLLPVQDVQEITDGTGTLDDPLLAAFAQTVLARSELRAGCYSDRFQQASMLAPSTSTGASPSDWPLPRSARARIRLQWLHATVGTPQFAPSPAALREWLDEAMTSDDIEHERLASAVLLRLLGSGPVGSDYVQTLDLAVRRLTAQSPLCSAHRETPPLVASVMRAWVALGQPDAARKLMEAWEESSLLVSRDTDTTAHALLATVYLVRRMRWRGLRDSLVLKLAAGGSPQQMLAARATRTLLGESADKTTSGQGPHAADIQWRTTRALSGQETVAALEAIHSLLVDVPDDPVVAANLALDRREAVLLRRRTNGPQLFRRRYTVSDEAERMIGHWLDTGRGSPAVAAELRAIKLRRRTLYAEPWSGSASAPHDWAETALEEGELLALRLPSEGARLLRRASRLFEQTGDLAGAVIASILRVTALYHAGEAFSAGTALDELSILYDRLRALSGSDLPAWDRLVEWRLERLGDTLVDGGWDGWLIRLAACIARRDGHPLDSSGLAGELDLSPVPDIWKRFAGIARWVASVPFVLAGLAVIGFGGRATLGAFGWRLSYLVGVPVGALAIFGAFIALGVPAAVFGPPLMRLIGARFRLTVTVSPKRSATGPPDRATLKFRPGSGVGALRLLLGYLILLYSLPEVLIGRPGLERPSDLPLHPDPLRSSLPPGSAAMLRLARSFHVDEMELRVGPLAASGAWEATLGLSQVIKADPPFGKGLNIFRVYTADPQRRTTAQPPRAAVLCTVAFALLAEESWAADNITSRIFYGEALQGYEQQADFNVLHVIGTPAESDLGPVLALGGQPLQPDRWVSPGLELIIVQTEPTRSSVSADPRSDAMRVIAQDWATASRGAAVIALPALPRQHAIALTNEITRVLAEGRLSRPSLLGLVRILRMRVFEHGDKEAAVAARAVAAFDVCCYIGE
jgi:hypothetical protein